MIAKIAARGSSIGGLVRYLFDKGDANEHIDQRIIAADEILDLADGTRLDFEADADRIAQLVGELDAHRKLAQVAPEGGWMWHCALSLPPGERLDDDQWAQAARSTMARLGFTADPDAGREACRWIAVHHGLSAGGNDHIHLAVNLIREDGTVADPGMDKRAMSRVCAELEREFGLSVVEGRESETGMPGYSRAEAQRAQREGRAEPDSLTLARFVRVAAGRVTGEAAFFTELRRAGLLIKTRESKDRSRVTGYAVALPPAEGEEPVWFGGGKMAPDLTLPKLRQTWQESALDPRGREGFADWTPDRVPTRAGSGAAPPSGEEAYSLLVWGQATERIEDLAAALTDVPDHDTAVWATAACHTAAVYGVLAIRWERQPSLYSDTCDALASYAQTPPGRQRVSRDHGLRHMRGVLKVASTASSSNHHWVLKFLRSLFKLRELIEKNRHAQQLARMAIEHATETESCLARIIAQHKTRLEPPHELNRRKRHSHSWDLGTSRSPSSPHPPTAADENPASDCDLHGVAL